MLPDYKIIQRAFPDRPDIEIRPVADVHLGAAEHNAEAWAAFRKSVLSKPNIYLLLVGDLLNFSTRNSIGSVFDETLRPREQKKLMVEMLRPFAEEGRLIAATTGNHELRGAKDADDDATYDILAKLDCEDIYRENEAFIKLQFGDPNNNGATNPTYILVMTHGAGGGALTGGVVNRGERTAYYYEHVDALIFAHAHKPFVTEPARISVDPHNNKVTVKPVKVVCCTSWLNYGGYAMRKMLPPSSISPQTIKLYGKTKKIEVTM